jgi:hypothetical protein
MLSFWETMTETVVELEEDEECLTGCEDNLFKLPG